MTARLMSTDEAATYLAVSTNQLRAIVAAREIVPLRLTTKGRPKFDRADLDEFIQRRKAAS